MVDSGRRRIRFNWTGLLTLVILAALWQVLVVLDWLNLKYLATPTEIIRQGWDLLWSSTFWGQVGHTVGIALLAWAIASVVGVVLGLLLGLSGIVRRFTLTSVNLLRVIPAIVFVPVLVLIVGLTTKMEIIIAVYTALWPVLFNALSGVRNVRPVVRDVSRTLRLGRWQTLTKIVLPSAAGPIAVGMSLALSLSLIMAVVAEIVGNPAGIGFEIVRQQQATRPDVMLAYVGFTGVIGLLLNVLFQGVLRTLPPGLFARGEGAR